MLHRRKWRLPQLRLFTLRFSGSATKNLLLLYLVIIITVLSLFITRFPADRAVFSNYNQTLIQENKFITLLQESSLSTNMFKVILSKTIPLLQTSDNSGASIDLKPKNVIDAVMYILTDINISNPQTFLKSQIPLLAAADSELEPVMQIDERDEIIRVEKPRFVKINPFEIFESEKERRVLPSDKPLVAIYHTHNSECYVPSSGVTHKAGEVGDIGEVGDALAKCLREKHHIEVVHSKNIHDSPEFLKAYAKSLVTAEQLLHDYKSIEIVMDIHRDDGAKAKMTTKINNQNVAKIAIVVGSDQIGLGHPNWKKNHAFAERVAAKMEKMYPGLFRGIIISKARYNQHLSEHSLIYEIGSSENTKEEAIRSAELLGNVIAEVLKEMPEPAKE